MKKTNLKRFLLLFCMLACVFSMTACGNAQIDTNTAKESIKDNEVAYVENYLKDWAKDMILYLDSNQGEAGTDALIADAEAGRTLNDVNSKMYIVNQQGMNVKTIGLYNSWNSTKDELGELKESVDVNNINVKVSDETSELCTISVKLKFEKRVCTFEFVINTDYTLESGAINPSYTTGEKMGKAGMNTLIGMGTVFVVLIFISFIISLFKYISVYENRKKEQKEDTASVGVDNAIAQIVSNEEENVEDDLELIAVITFEFVINTDYTLESGAINPSYTTGEKMGKAGMNTLIGMGTVFVVLIFISFIISLFKYISVYENRKKEQKEDTASVGVDNAIAQIVSNEEENVEDDLELIAVITAAIAASEGTSTDGLVVRSIRKVNNRRK